MTKKKPAPKKKIHVRAPNKLTKKLTDKAVILRRKGVSIRDICLVVGLHTTTFHDWMERGQLKEKGLLRDFYDQLTEAEGMWAVDCCETISRAASDDWKAAAYWLRRKDPEYDPERHYREVKTQDEEVTSIELKMSGIPDQDDEKEEHE